MILALRVLLIALCLFRYTQPIEVETTSSCFCSNEVDSRIVRGELAEDGAYPWMVSIFNENSLHCGGSLINDRYVLTAAHCLKWVDFHLRVFLGVYDTEYHDKKNSNATEVEIEKLQIHENYTFDDYHETNDVGLIKLKTPVTFTSNLTPICLPRDENENYESATVIGWGRTSESGYLSRLLRKTELPIMPNDECKKADVVGKYILPSMLCAYKDDTDACQGDSGGPLIANKHGRFEQIGVVSYGSGCAVKDIPGVYSRMTYFKDWILEHTQDAVYCADP